MAKKTKEAEDERELREVFRVFDKNSRGVIDVRRFDYWYLMLDGFSLGRRFKNDF